eukprot:1590187-Ditylum_brightwellii.AAC.2
MLGGVSGWVCWWVLSWIWWRCSCQKGEFVVEGRKKVLAVAEYVWWGGDAEMEAFGRDLDLVGA